jgi:acyl-CoA hydrolase
MPVSPPEILDSVEACAEAIVARLGNDIRIGMPLGLGKPVELVNALYALAKADARLKLTILTALSLEKPKPGKGLEAAFMGPFLQRVFADAPELEYAKDQTAGRVPANVRVVEFFFKPGSRLSATDAQADYISTNYTHAARDVFNQGCNVVAGMICKREAGGSTRYSLSCNPDTGPELMKLLIESQRPFISVGLVNQNLPFMEHDAEVGPDNFHMIVDHPSYTKRLFSTPKMAVTTPDYAIGLHASSLIKDGGTLQIGIGALGDAIVYAAQQRHGNNAAYQQALAAVGATTHNPALIERWGGVAPFEKGLYGATEMFVDGFQHLYASGILKRQVFDFWALQQLINDGRCNPHQLDPSVLDALESLGVRVIRTKDFETLQYHGFFNEQTRYEQGYLIAPNGERVIANVAEPASRKVMAEHCLGRELKNGIVLHGGFFLGPNAFYEALRQMPDAERRLICMAGVDKINQLDLNPRLYIAQRIHARFINTGIMVTLSGAVVSDGLADGRVVSGVGGQYNFVAMAHQLSSFTEGGRSILMIRAVRDKEGKGAPSSNVVFNYGHCTIPRHLRDLIITEYGVADLRSRTDREVAKALINVADSRFQPELLAQAKANGKIEQGYQVPEAFRNNTPEALEAKLKALKQQGLFPAFPLGCDLSAEELKIGKALKAVKAKATSTPKWKLVFQAWQFNPARDIPAEVRPYLERLQLTEAKDMEQKVAQMLLVQALA